MLKLHRKAIGLFGVLLVGSWGLSLAIGLAQEPPPKPIPEKLADPPVTVPATPPGEPGPKAATVTETPAAGGDVKSPAAANQTPMPIVTTPVPENQPTLSAPAPPAVTPPPPRADRYFILIFGAESVPKRGRFTHTWYTIVKATPRANDLEAYDLQAHTISWLPASLRIRVLKLRAECGVNLALIPSIRYCQSQGECVALWGPYEVNPAISAELYAKSLKQIDKLNSGRKLYKAVDPDHGPRASYTSNCIHAVTDMDGLPRRSMYDERRYFGMQASQNLAKIMINAGRVDPSVKHEWVADALGINDYRVQRRSIGPCVPVSPAVTNMPASSTK